MSALIEKILSYSTNTSKAGKSNAGSSTRDEDVDISDAIAEDLCPQFVWHLGKGEFLHWVDVFNMFDSYLSIVTRNGTTKDSSSCLSISTEKETYFSATRIAHESAPNFISKKDVCAFLISCGEVVRGDDNESKDDDDKNRREKRRDYMKRKKTLLWILRCTRAILDECWNKHMYNSLEQLTKLLHHEDFEVAYEALLTIHSVAKKTPGTSVNRFVPCDGLTMRLLMLVRMNNCDENENKKNEGAAVKKLFQDLELTFLFDKNKEEEDGGEGDSTQSSFNILDECNVSRMREIVERIEMCSEVDSNEPASAVEAVIDSRLRVQEEGFNRRTKHQEELFKKLWTLRWSSFAARDSQSNANFVKDARENVSNLALATLLQFGDSTEDVSYDRNYTLTKTPIPSHEMRRLIFQTSTMQEKASELVQQLDDRITNIQKVKDNSNSEPSTLSEREGERDLVSDFSTDASVAAWALSALVNERDTSSAVSKVLRTHKSATTMESLFTISVEKLMNAPNLSKRYFDTATDATEERESGRGKKTKKKNTPMESYRYFDISNRKSIEASVLAESAFALLANLSTIPIGCNVLCDANALEPLLKLFKHERSDHIPFLAIFAHSLEMMLDYNVDSNRIFCESGGVELLCSRLRQEIETSLREYEKMCESLKNAHASIMNVENENDGKLLTDTSSKVRGSGSKRKKSEQTSINDNEEGTPPQRQKRSDGTSSEIVEKATKGDVETNDVVLPSYVAYSRRVLIKALTRSLAFAIFGPSVPHDAYAVGLDGPNGLNEAMRLVFDNAQKFGGSGVTTFASLVTDYLNHDPTCYVKLESAGVFDALFCALENESIANNSKVLCVAPQVISATCLHKDGKKKVIDRGILSKVMYPAFTKQIYQKALSAPDVASAIGTNVDELLRHVPELRQHGVEMLYKIFDQIRKTCEKRCEYCKKSPLASKSYVNAWRTCLVIPKDAIEGETAPSRVIDLCSECEIRKKPNEMAEREWHILPPLKQSELDSDDKLNTKVGENPSLGRARSKREKAIATRGKFHHDLILHATRLLEGIVQTNELVHRFLAHRTDSNSRDSEEEACFNAVEPILLRGENLSGVEVLTRIFVANNLPNMFPTSAAGSDFSRLLRKLASKDPHEFSSAFHAALYTVLMDFEARNENFNQSGLNDIKYHSKEVDSECTIDRVQEMNSICKRLENATKFFATLFRMSPVALSSFYKRFHHRFLDLFSAHGGALSSIDFLRNIILKGGDVAMSQNAKWTLESYKRLKETIVSTFVTISRPPSATWPQIYLNDRDKIKEYERKQWASVAAILLQLENKMFQSYEKISKVKRDVREYIDWRQKMAFEGSKPEHEIEYVLWTPLFILNEIEEYVHMVASVLGYSTDRRDKSHRAFAPAIILARKYGIIDLISRAILPEIIELKVELAHVSRLLGEIARSLPLGRNLNQEIVRASLSSADTCICTAISFFEKLSNLEAFPTMLSRGRWTLANIHFTDWDLLLKLLGGLGNERDGAKNKPKKAEKEKGDKIDFENANDDDYCVQELENHMMQKGWNVLSRSFRTGYTAEEVSKRLGKCKMPQDLGISLHEECAHVAFTIDRAISREYLLSEGEKKFLDVDLPFYSKDVLVRVFRILSRCFRGTQQGGAGFFARGLCGDDKDLGFAKLSKEVEEREKSSIRTKANSDVSISPETLQLIVEMGFSERAAQTAVTQLCQTRHAEQINVETIAEYLLAHPETEEEANKAQQCSDKVTDTSGGKNTKATKSEKTIALSKVKKHPLGGDDSLSISLEERLRERVPELTESLWKILCLDAYKATTKVEYSYILENKAKDEQKWDNDSALLLEFVEVVCDAFILDVNDTKVNDLRRKSVAEIIMKSPVEGFPDANFTNEVLVQYMENSGPCQRSDVRHFHSFDAVVGIRQQAMLLLCLRDSKFREVFQHMDGLKVEDYVQRIEIFAKYSQISLSTREDETNVIAASPLCRFRKIVQTTILVLHMYAQWLPVESGLSSFPLNDSFLDTSPSGSNVSAFAKEIDIIAGRPFGSVDKDNQKRIIESLDAILRFYAWAQLPAVYEKQMYSPPDINSCLFKDFIDSNAAIEATRCPLTRKKLHEIRQPVRLKDKTYEKSALLHKYNLWCAMSGSSKLASYDHVRLLGKDISKDEKSPFKTPDGETHDEIEVEKALMGYDIKAANFKAKFYGKELKGNNPGSHAPQIQAALTLLEHFTKSYENVTTWLNNNKRKEASNLLLPKLWGCEVLMALRSLPQHSFIAFTNLLASIFRHVAEDPNTLRHAMECEIKKSLEAAFHSSDGGMVSASVFLTVMSPVMARDVHTFFTALEKCAFCVPVPNPKENKKGDLLILPRYEMKKILKEEEMGIPKNKKAEKDDKVEADRIPPPSKSFVQLIRILLKVVKGHSVADLKLAFADGPVPAPETLSLQDSSNPIPLFHTHDRYEEPYGRSTDIHAIAKVKFALRLLSEFIEVHTAAGAVLVELDKSDASVGGVLKHTFCRLMSKETTSWNEKLTALEIHEAPTCPEQVPSGTRGYKNNSFPSWQGVERAAHFLATCTIRVPGCRDFFFSMVAQLLQNDFTVIASSYKSKYNNARYQGHLRAALDILLTIVSHCMPSRSESIRDISNKVSSANVQNGETLAALHRHKILRLLLKSVENYCIDELQSSNRPEHSILDATLKVIDKLTNVYEKMSKEISSSEDQDKDRDGQHRLDHSLAAVIDAVLREDDEAMMENIRAMEDEEVEEALYVEEEEEDAMLADEEAMMEDIRAMEDEEVEEAVYEDMTTSDDDNNAEDEETGFEVGSESDDDLIIDGHDSDDDDGDEDDDSENHFDDFSDDELDPEDEREMERLVERGMIDEFARDDRQGIGNRIRQRSNQIVPVDSDGGYSDEEGEEDDDMTEEDEEGDFENPNSFVDEENVNHCLNGEEMMSRDENANISRRGGSMRDINRDRGVSFHDDAWAARFRRTPEQFLGDSQGPFMTADGRAFQHGADVSGRRDIEDVIDEEEEEEEEEEELLDNREEDEEIFIGNDESELSDEYDDAAFTLSDIFDRRFSNMDNLTRNMPRREREGDGSNRQSQLPRSLESPIEPMNVFELSVEDLRRLASGEYTRRERDSVSLTARQDTGSAYLLNTRDGQSIRDRHGPSNYRYTCESEGGIGVMRRHLPSRRTFPDAHPLLIRDDFPTVTTYAIEMRCAADGATTSVPPNVQPATVSTENATYEDTYTSRCAQMIRQQNPTLGPDGRRYYQQMHLRVNTGHVTAFAHRLAGLPTPIADAPPEVVHRMRDELRRMSSDLARLAQSSGNPMLHNLDSLSFDPYDYVDINGYSATSATSLMRNQILSPAAGGATTGERHQMDMSRINVDFDGTGNDLLSMSGVLIYCGSIVLNGEVDQDALGEMAISPEPAWDLSGLRARRHAWTDSARSILGNGSTALAPNAPLTNNERNIVSASISAVLRGLTNEGFRTSEQQRRRSVDQDKNIEKKEIIEKTSSETPRKKSTKPLTVSSNVKENEKLEKDHDGDDDDDDECDMVDLTLFKDDASWIPEAMEKLSRESPDQTSLNALPETIRTDLLRYNVIVKRLNDSPPKELHQTRNFDEVDATFLAALPPDIQKDALSQAKSILESARSSMWLNRTKRIARKKVALQRAEDQKKEELIKEKNEKKWAQSKEALDTAKKNLKIIPYRIDMPNLSKEDGQSLLICENLCRRFHKESYQRALLSLSTFALCRDTFITELWSMIDPVLCRSDASSSEHQQIDLTKDRYGFIHSEARARRALATMYWLTQHQRKFGSRLPSISATMMDGSPTGITVFERLLESLSSPVSLKHPGSMLANQLLILNESFRATKISKIKDRATEKQPDENVNQARLTFDKLKAHQLEPLTKLLDALSVIDQGRFGNAILSHVSSLMRHFATASQKQASVLTVALLKQAKISRDFAKTQLNLCSSGNTDTHMLHAGCESVLRVVRELAQLTKQRSQGTESDKSNSERRVVPDTFAGVSPISKKPPSSTIDSKSKDQEVPGENALLELSEAMKPAWQALSAAAQNVDVLVTPHKPGAAPPPAPLAITAMLPAVEAYFALADALAPDQLEEVSKKMAEKQQERKEPASTGNGQELIIPGTVAPNTSANNTPIKMSQPSRASTPGLLRASSVKFTSKLGLDALLENTTVADELKSRLSTEAWKFAERHRSVINALLRRNPQLLTTSLKTLLRTPALVDFDVKRAHIQLKLKKEKEKYVSRGTSKLKIRRSHLLEDSYNQLRARTDEEVKGRMQIVFAGEEGVDAGGLTREWYQILAREIFNPNWGLFQLAPSGEACYEPNKHSSINPEHLTYFRFVGRLIGKALYDGVLLDAYFTRPIYKHLLGQPLTFEDMEGVDPDYYKNLKWMLENDIEGILELNFSDTQNFFGETKTVDLIKNGRNVSVTNVNKLDYVNLITAFRMTDAVKDQLEAFIEGFTKVVDRDIIGVLNASELELLISGTPDIDLDDLKANTEYHGGYTPTSPQIRWFWEIVREMNLEDRARLLMFCTGTSKVPLEGFEKLRGMSGLQKFQIHKAQANDVNQLCTAHTCFNQLDLIAYDTKEELKEKLLYSIREGSQGFGFA